MRMRTMRSTPYVGGRARKPMYRGRTMGNRYSLRGRQGLGGRMNSNLTRRSLNVFRNPFSVSTVSAKIPDGNVTLSSAQRFQLMSQVTIPGDAPPSGNVAYVVLTAGFSTAAFVSKDSFSGNVVEGTTDVLAQIKYSEQPLAPDMPAQIAKWRVISTGVKFSQVNNSETNEGFWEAIRISSTATDIGVVTAAEEIIDGTVNMVNHASYCNGKMRDIQKYFFQVKPDGISHNFNANDDLYDNAFDIVIIKLTGRASTETQTQLIAHFVSNQEIVYVPGNTLHRFHTECSYDQAWNAQVHAATIDIKAATRSYS